MGLKLSVTRYETDICEEEEDEEEGDLRFKPQKYWYEVMYQDHQGKIYTCFIWGKKKLLEFLQGDMFGLGERYMAMHVLEELLRGNDHPTVSAATLPQQPRYILKSVCRIFPTERYVFV